MKPYFFIAGQVCVKIEYLREELRKANRNGVVPAGKAVIRKSRYDLVIFEE
jgi:hypothetical protein